VERKYEKGKLYQFNGSEFVELEPSGEAKIPVSDAAMEAVKAVRKKAQTVIGMRPELSLVASAMILEAEKSSAIAESVRAYGRHIYGTAVVVVSAGAIQQQSNETPESAKAQPEQNVFSIQH
jgi:hypothetical protein